MANQQCQRNVNKFNFKLKAKLIEEKGSYRKVEIVTIVWKSIGAKKKP